MSDTSYEGALIAAGATVRECKWFGSYQGIWMADVTLPDGRSGLIRDYYGSCSGCDAFEAEFGYDSHRWADGHPNGEPLEGCEKCAEYKAKLAAFGLKYFDGLTTADALATDMADESYWSGYDEMDEQAAFLLARLTPDAPAHIALTARLAKNQPTPPPTPEQAP